MALLNEDHEKGVEFVTLANFARVMDSDQHTVVAKSVDALRHAQETGDVQIVTALHVGGLNSRKNRKFSDALERAHLVYADGIAIVTLAKLAGGRWIERAATTDIGLPIIAGAAVALNRPARVALLGGQDGLAARAGAHIQENVDAEVVFTSHGYHSEDKWVDVLNQLTHAKPDVILLGLGSPRELIFADQRRPELPAALLLTCGGWFGFLSGEERRAPRGLQNSGLEWLHRLFLDPRRLASRYGKGILAYVSVGAQIVFDRYRRA